jgi:phage-related protein
MATFSYAPDYGAAKSQAPSVQAVQFGDGYEARYAYGLNTNPATWDLQFSLRDSTEGPAIDAFLTDKGGVTPFSWTPPGASSAINVICKEWTFAQPSPLKYTITAKFKQVFDP